ncbi:hypothetical protein HAX54_023652, partial [Datura stramonium]|nr:hypothetical protein [Datura stramonium]
MGLELFLSGSWRGSTSLEWSEAERGEGAATGVDKNFAVVYRSSGVAPVGFFLRKGKRRQE